MTNPSFSFAQLIRPVGRGLFFREYWQRQPLSLDLDKYAFVRVLADLGPLEIVSMAKKARQGVQAWISGDHISHSVFEADATTVSDFHRVGATLYFVDVAVPNITDQI